MEFIHTDISGPFPVKGHEGSRYWVTFLDDYTKDAEVRAIAEKSDFFAEFRGFIERNERPEHRCHRVRLDNSGEARLDEFRVFCAERGIDLEITTTEQHQSNGAAERLNGNLREKLHPTLLNARIPLKYWPEVLQAIAHIRSRSPSAKIGMTPYEKRYGKKPDLAHLRVIGSPGYTLKKGSKRRKLADTRSEKCVLLGFDGGTIYVVLLEDGTIIKTNNVIFNEQKIALKVHRSPSNLPLEQTDTRDISTNKRPGKRACCSIIGTSSGETKLGELEPLGESLLSMPRGSTARARGPFTNSPLSTPSEIPLSSPPPDFHPSLPLNQQDTIVLAQTAQANPHEISPQVLTDYPELRVSSRINKGQYPQRWAFLNACIAMVAERADPFEPRTLQEAQNDSAWELWRSAMMEEKKSLDDNHTWNMIDRPTNRRILGGKWVFKHKRGVTGEIVRYKARWVVRGFEQQEGVDYNETFASVVKPMSYKVIFALAAALGLLIEQMDVKTAFLYGDIDEEIYVEQPTGLEAVPGKVCLLNKALYGLKQSPRIWYNTLAGFLKGLSFNELSSDLEVFARGNYYIAICVDDLLIVGTIRSEVDKIKAALKDRFEMTDLGPCNYYLGMSVKRDLTNRSLFLGQRAYLEKVIRDFGMADCKPVTLPIDPNTKLHAMPSEYETPAEDRTWYASCIGSLMYAMLGTRPDIAFVESLLSRYMAKPGPEHISAAKRVLRYLKETLNLELVYRGDLKPLAGYTDAD